MPTPPSAATAPTGETNQPCPNAKAPLIEPRYVASRQHKTLTVSGFQKRILTISHRHGASIEGCSAVNPWIDAIARRLIPLFFVRTVEFEPSNGHDELLEAKSLAPTLVPNTWPVTNFIGGVAADHCPRPWKQPKPTERVALANKLLKELNSGDRIAPGPTQLQSLHRRTPSNAATFAAPVPG